MSKGKKQKKHGSKGDRAKVTKNYGPNFDNDSAKALAKAIQERENRKR